MSSNCLPETQDNFNCKAYPNGKHRVVYGTCQKPASNGELCKVCMANPKGVFYFKRTDIMRENQ